MKNYLIITGLCLLLSACGIVTPTYFGDKYPATNTVDLYYSAHDVKQPYKVIGHLTIQNTDQETVKTRLTGYAKTIGADAIVILGTDATKDNQAAVINADALKYDQKTN
jgi:hypothetical protein